MTKLQSTTKHHLQNPRLTLRLPKSIIQKNLTILCLHYFDTTKTYNCSQEFITLPLLH